MNKNHQDNGLRDELAAWDPAERFGEPPPGLMARVRESLQDEPPALLPGLLSPARLGWAMAILILLVAAFAWQKMPVGLGTGKSAMEAQTTVRLQLRSSNGTRIFWTIQPAPLSDAGERRNQ